MTDRACAVIGGVDTHADSHEAAARKVLAGECSAIPKDTSGVVEGIRQLHLVRAGAVQARTAALNRDPATAIMCRNGVSSETSSQ